MPIRKVLEMNGGRSGGITLPKDDIEADGVMRDGELDGETYACVSKIDDGTTLKLNSSMRLSLINKRSFQLLSQFRLKGRG